MLIAAAAAAASVVVCGGREGVKMVGWEGVRGEGVHCCHEHDLKAAH